MFVLLFSYIWYGGISWLEGLYLGLLNHGYLHTLPSSHRIFCIFVCSFFLQHRKWCPDTFPQLASDCCILSSPLLPALLQTELLFHTLIQLFSSCVSWHWATSHWLWPGPLGIIEEKFQAHPIDAQPACDPQETFEPLFAPLPVVFFEAKLDGNIFSHPTTILGTAELFFPLLLTINLGPQLKWMSEKVGEQIPYGPPEREILHCQCSRPNSHL